MLTILFNQYAPPDAHRRNDAEGLRTRKTGLIYARGRRGSWRYRRTK